MHHSPSAAPVLAAEEHVHALLLALRCRSTRGSGVPGLCHVVPQLLPRLLLRRAVTAVAPAMQVNNWLMLIMVLICLMCGTPWKWYTDKMVTGRQLSSDYAATEAALQAVVAQLSSQQAASEATLQAVVAQLSTQQAISKATLQAVRAQDRLLTAHLDPPHSKAPAVSINC